MKKESVVVFEGEDNFILPRNVSYNRRKGKSTFVGQDGVKQEDGSKPQEATKDIVDSTSGGGGTDTRGSDTGGGTGTGTGTGGGRAQMPDPTDPAFCDKIQMYIVTNGDGTATPQEVMSAHSAFQKYCRKVPPIDEGSDTGGGGTGGGTGGDTGGGTGGGTTGGGKPPLPDKPYDPTKPDKAPDRGGAVVTTITDVQNLGLPLISTGGFAGGGGGGGGSDEKKPAAAKKSYWWLLIVVAAAAGGYYLYKRRR